MNNVAVSTLANALAESGKSIFSRNEILEKAKSLGMGWGTVKHIVCEDHKVSRGKYTVQNILGNVVPMTQPNNPSVEAAKPEVASPSGVRTVSNKSAYMPEKNPVYVRPPIFKDVDQIVKSGMFFPLYISGPSGTGKTELVEQVIANNKGRMIRVQITEETDRDALLGGLRLINGDTVFQEGPVARAAREGITVLIDEFDRGTNMMMALQGVLEGKPFELPYSGEMIQPTPGFNVIATANTKSRGSDSGRYNGAKILDDALIERFNMFIHHGHPTSASEMRILAKAVESITGEKVTEDQADFIGKLTTWSKVIRDTYVAEGVDDEISTRRLLMICKSYLIFGDRLNAVKGAIGRYDDETIEAFLDLYTKVDEGAIKDESESNLSDLSEE